VELLAQTWPIAVLEAEPELVRAEFACDVCLGRPSTIRVSGRAGRRVATAECARCQRHKRSELTDDQAALLWRLNRQVTYVHFAADAI
jgi:hypothetical protein